MDEIKKDETVLAEVLEETLPEELNEYMNCFNSAMEKLENRKEELEKKIEEIEEAKQEVLKAQNDIEQIRASYSSELIEVNKRHNEGIESINEAIKKCGDNEALNKAVEVEEREKKSEFDSLEKEVSLEIEGIIKFLEPKKEVKEEIKLEPNKEFERVSEFNLENLLKTDNGNSINLEPDFNLNSLNDNYTNTIIPEKQEEIKYEELTDKTLVPEETIKEVLSSTVVMQNVKDYLNNLTRRAS